MKIELKSNKILSKEEKKKQKEHEKEVKDDLLKKIEKEFEDYNPTLPKEKR